MVNIIKETRDEQWRLHSYNNEPAIEYNDGNKEWWHHGKRHRENGPAVQFINGHKQWYIHGKLHREDGPAIIRSNGNKFWFINGKGYTFHEWIKLVSLNEEHKVELLLSHD